jgi:hypothetical protein
LELAIDVKGDVCYEDRVHNRSVFGGADFPYVRPQWLSELYSPASTTRRCGTVHGNPYTSHYLWVIFAFQVIPGILLLANRYVPLAVAMLAPVIVNILTFHALMAPSGLPLALLVAVLWVAVFVDVRAAFAGLFQSRLQARV